MFFIFLFFHSVVYVVALLVLVPLLLSPRAPCRGLVSFLFFFCLTMLWVCCWRMER
jgi:hypothetical protein